MLPNVAGTLDEDFLTVALLQHQFFPSVKTKGEELPPIFTSRSFSLEAAEELSKIERKDFRTTGWVELRTRRFDGLVRRLGVPHPVTYSKLVLHLRDNWASLAFLAKSEHSKIKPEWHADGRIIHMDYESSEQMRLTHTRLAHGSNFLVKSDISNCFPSIYAHSLDWALRGKAVAKASARGKGGWAEELDTRSRNIQHGETAGLMIGPAVSNLLAEIVLQKVDETLLSAGYMFTRYVDDYTAYCLDRRSAERFIVDLHRALAEYRLDINTRKTQIRDLQTGDDDEWISAIYAALPDVPTATRVSRYLRRCESLASEYKSKSVLKLAVKLLAGLQEETATPISLLEIEELVRLCQYHPHLTPFLARQLRSALPGLGKETVDRFCEVLSGQLSRAAERGETDVVLWLLHIICDVLDRSMTSLACQELLRMGDDLVMVAIACLCKTHRGMVASYVRGLSYLCSRDYEERWLVRYELWRIGLLSDGDLCELEKLWMKPLRARRVQFSELMNT